MNKTTRGAAANKQSSSAGARHILGAAIGAPAPTLQEASTVAEIPGQIDRLGSAVDQLNTAIQGLSDRLRPVIGSDLDASILPEGVGSMSPVGQRVESETDRLFNAVRVIEALTGSLAL